MQLKRLQKFQRGLTLIELMISVALGLLVIFGVIYVTTATMRTNTQTLGSTHLNQELRAAMQMMTRDLRRAGYRYDAELVGVYTANNGITIAPLSGNPITLTAPASAPFGKWIIGARIRHVPLGSALSYCIDITSPTSGTSFTTATGAVVDCDDSATDTSNFPAGTLGAGSWTIEDPNGGIKYTANCVSFGYDHDNDEGNGVISSSEQIGYRYDPGSTDKALEFGYSGADCATNTFNTVEKIIAPDISGVNITAFTVTNLGPVNPIPSGNVDIRLLELQLTLTGQLVNDPTVTRSITEVVRVRNDQLT